MHGTKSPESPRPMRVSRALNRVAAQIQIEIRSVIFCELAKDNANQFARFW